MQSLGNELGDMATVDYMISNSTKLSRVYATGDVELAKHAAFFTSPDLDEALEIDKSFDRSLVQTYVLNLPQKW